MSTSSEPRPRTSSSWRLSLAAPLRSLSTSADHSSARRHRSEVGHQKGRIMAVKRQRRQGPPAATAEEIAVVRRLVEAGGQPMVGAPVRCPKCPGWAMAERLDVDTLRFDYRCPSCGEAWVLSAVALRAAALADAAPAAATPVAATVGPVGAEAPVVRVTWSAASATSTTWAARRSAG